MHEMETDEEHDHEKPTINYEELAEKYKQKFIILARAYAKLLNTIESYEVAFQQSKIKINPKKSNASNNEEDQLLLCNEESTDNKHSLNRWESTKSELSMGSVTDDIVFGNTPNGDVTNATDDDAPNTMNLERYESVLSRKSTFSTFISQCGTDLGPMPELDCLLNATSTIYKNMSLSTPSMLPPLLETNNSTTTVHKKISLFWVRSRSG